MLLNFYDRWQINTIQFNTIYKYTARKEKNSEFCMSWEKNAAGEKNWRSVRPSMDSL